MIMIIGRHMIVNPGQLTAQHSYAGIMQISTYIEISLVSICDQYNYEKLIELEKRSEVNSDVLDCIYNRIIVILRFGSDVAVLSCKKSFFKLWWDSEMNELKEKSIASCRMWKTAGRPQCGPIYDRYRRDKAAYRHGLRSKQRNEKEIYTNDLHEALI